MRLTKDMLSIDLYDFLVYEPSAVEVSKHTSKRYPYFNVNGTALYLFKSSNYKHFNCFQTVNEVPLTLKFSPGKAHQGNIGELALLISNNDLVAADNLIRNYANIPLLENFPQKQKNHSDNLYTPKAIGNIDQYFKEHLLDCKYAEHYLKNRHISTATIQKHKTSIFSIAAFSKSKKGEKYFPLTFPIYTQDNKIIAIQQILPQSKMFFQKSADANFNNHIDTHGFLLLDGIWKSVIDNNLPYVITESPIDTLSYAQLNPHGNYNLIATMGSLNEMKINHILHETKNQQAIMAFDNDHAGLISALKLTMAQNGIPNTDFNIKYNKLTDSFELTNQLSKESFILTKTEFVEFIQHAQAPNVSLHLPKLKDFNDDLKERNLSFQENIPDLSNHSKLKSIAL